MSGKNKFRQAQFQVNNHDKNVEEGEVRRAVVIAVLITAVVVGVLMYIWQDSRVRATELQFQDNIAELQERIEQLERVISGEAEMEEIEETEEIETETSAEEEPEETGQLEIQEDVQLDPDL